MSSNLPSPHQIDLFKEPVFASRVAVPDIDLDRFRSRVKRAMSAAITRSPMTRDELCDAISAMPGMGTFSRSMLDNYTSESKTHDISLVRFKALSRQIDAPELWDILVSDEGLIILQGDEARLAEIARLQQEARQITHQLRKLRSEPVHIKRDM